jgi:hypothetical protein
MHQMILKYASLHALTSLLTNSLTIAPINVYLSALLILITMFKIMCVSLTVLLIPSQTQQLESESAHQNAQMGYSAIPFLGDAKLLVRLATGVKTLLIVVSQFARRVLLIISQNYA